MALTAHEQRQQRHSIVSLFCIFHLRFHHSFFSFIPLCVEFVCSFFRQEYELDASLAIEHRTLLHCAFKTDC